MPLNSSKRAVLQFFEKFANVDKGETIPVTGNRRCSAWVIYGGKRRVRYRRRWFSGASSGGEIVTGIAENGFDFVRNFGVRIWII